MAIDKGTKKRSILACLMLCALLACAGTLQAATPAQLSDAKANHPRAAHQATAQKAPAATLPPGQLLIPANGNASTPPSSWATSSLYGKRRINLPQEWTSFLVISLLTT